MSNPMHEPKPFSPLPPWAQQGLDSVQEILRGELPEGLQHLLTAEDYGLPVLQPFPLRPYLLLLVARHYGCSGPRAVRLAASIHMIHLASLLHERLGNISTPCPEEADPVKAHHHQESMDILLGDFFFSKASCIIIEDGDTRIIEDMIQTSLSSAEAQARIVGLDDDPGSREPSHCFDTVADKQSLFIALALRVGAVLGDADPGEITSLSGHGRFLGKTLRIVRDIDFWENPPESVFRLPREAKYSHPLLLLWEGQGLEDWKGIVSRLQEPEREHLMEIRSRIRGQGYIQGSYEKAREYAESAVLELDRHPGLRGFEELKSFARDPLFRNVRPEEEVPL